MGCISNQRGLERSGIMNGTNFEMRGNLKKTRFHEERPVLFYQIQDAAALDEIYRTLKVSISVLLYFTQHTPHHVAKCLLYQFFDFIPVGMEGIFNRITDGVHVTPIYYSTF